MGRPQSNKSQSNKDYCKRYREKNKDALRKKERERKEGSREYEKYVCSEKYQQRLQNDRFRSREYRKRKKAESSQANQTPSTSSQDTSSATSSQASESAFGSKQSFCRSISRAGKYLPNSPRKKTEVIGNLAKKYNLRIQLKENRGCKAKILSQEQERWLVDYLERPEMCYTNPGRKDNVYIGKINGTKQYVQKRYLLWTLRDALGILNNQEDGFHINFEEELSFGIFYRFIKRKKQFVYQRDIPDTSCLCEVCENAAMMAKAIRKQKSGHPTNAHDIVEKYSCDSDDPKCMKNICETCQPAKIIQSWDADSPSSLSETDASESSDDDESDYISFTMWIREDKKIKKSDHMLGAERIL